MFFKKNTYIFFVIFFFFFFFLISQKTNCVRLCPTLPYISLAMSHHHWGNENSHWSMFLCWHTCGLVMVSRFTLPFKSLESLLKKFGINYFKSYKNNLVKKNKCKQWQYCTCTVELHRFQIISRTPGNCK